MFFLILESLGSTELLFILVMALVFFGPRKLPQLSRSLGKNIAEFRRASEDFKRTWDREVSLEETSAAAPVNGALLPEQNSIMREKDEAVIAPAIQPLAPDKVIARHSLDSVDFQRPTQDGARLGQADEPASSSKRDWL